MSYAHIRGTAALGHLGLALWALGLSQNPYVNLPFCTFAFVLNTLIAAYRIGQALAGD